MNIDNLTIAEAKQLATLLGSLAAPAAAKRITIPVGAKIFVRTVTHHYTGQVVACTDEELQLRDAAWIADDGRFATSLKAFEFSEVEPYPDGLHPILNRGSFIDCVVVPDGYELPRVQK